jgi:hypothetical protein
MAVEEGTCVRLKLGEALSTKTSTEGQKVQLAVAEDVFGKDGKTVLIKEGAPAVGYLKDVDDKSCGRGAKLSIEISSVRAIDDSRVQLRAVKAKTGRNGAGVGAYIVGGVLFGVLGLGVVALCGQSKHAQIPAGTVISAFVECDSAIALPHPVSIADAKPITDPVVDSSSSGHIAPSELQTGVVTGSVNVPQ